MSTTFLSQKCYKTFKNPYSGDPFFRYFFGGQNTPQPREQEGIGSGFIISAGGLVITNEHVIDGAEDIKVTLLGEEKEYSATVVGADYDLDLALLQIKGAKDLPYLKLGDSNNTRVGNWAIAIGNPFGFDHTVTVGVISAKEGPSQWKTGAIKTYCKLMRLLTRATAGDHC